MKKISLGEIYQILLVIMPQVNHCIVNLSTPSVPIPVLTCLSVSCHFSHSSSEGAAVFFLFDLCWPDVGRPNAKLRNC